MSNSLKIQNKNKKTTSTACNSVIMGIASAKFDRESDGMFTSK